MPSRPYAESDLPRILRFLSAVWSGSETIGYFHTGDFLWRSYTPEEDFDRRRNIRIWEAPATGEMAGFAWTMPGDYGEYFPRPDLAATSLEEEMLAWMEARTAELLSPEMTMTFETGGPVPDTPHLRHRRREDALRRAGYRGTGEVYVLMEWQQRVPDQRALPPGFAVSSHAEGVTLDQLLAHREQHDPERYRKLTTMQGYRADLDLAVLDPDGTVAAYCICWYDPDSRSGLFEPVGTLPAYRRKGLAHNLLIEGIRRLQSKGAQRIFVRTAEANEPAVHLYHSAGFAITARDQNWSKVNPKK